jgi:hypothetical protein
LGSGANLRRPSLLTIGHKSSLQFLLMRKMMIKGEMMVEFMDAILLSST